MTEQSFQAYCLKLAERGDDPPMPTESLWAHLFDFTEALAPEHIAIRARAEWVLSSKEVRSLFPVFEDPEENRTDSYRAFIRTSIWHQMFGLVRE